MLNEEFMNLERQAAESIVSEINLNCPFERIGTKKINYEFEILVEKIEIKNQGPCTLSVLMKRGSRKAETQKKLVYDPSKSFVPVDEALLMKAALYLNNKNGKFLDKMAYFFVKVMSGKSGKSGGEIKVNLSFYPNNNIKEKREILKLEKGSDSNAKLFLLIKCNKLGEAPEDDDSDESDNKSQVSRSDISFDKELEDSKNLSARPDNPSTPKNILPTSLKNLDEPHLKKPEDKNPNPIYNKKIFNNNLEERKEKVPDFGGNKKKDEKISPGKGFKEKIEEPKKNETINNDKKFDTFMPPAFGKKQNPPAEPNPQKILKFDDEDEEESEIIPKFGVSQTNNNINNAMKPFENPEPKQKNFFGNNFPESKTKVEEKYSFGPMAKNKEKVVEEDKNLTEEAEIIKAETSEEDEPIILLPSHDEEENDENKSESDKDEIKNLDKILELEKMISGKNLQITEMIKKLEEANKKIEELKQANYKSNKETSNQSRTVQIENEKLKSAVKESEEKRNSLQEENRELSNKFKKLEMEHKNLRSDYNNLQMEMKNQQESVNDILGAKDNIESANKSYSIELQKHKDKITSLTTEVNRLRDELRKSTDENGEIKKDISVLKQQNDRLKKQIETEDEKPKISASFSNETTKEQENQILELKTQLRKMDAAREESLSSQTKLALEMQNLQIEKETMKVKLEAKMRDITRLESEKKSIEELTSKEIENLKLKLDKEKKARNEENEESNDAIKTLEDQIHELQNNLHESELEKGKIKAEYEQDKLKNKDNPQISNSLENFRKLMERQQSSMKEEIERLKKENLEKEEKINEMEQEITGLNIKSNKLALTQKNSAIFESFNEDQIKQKNDELELKILELEDLHMVEMEKLNEEIKDLKAKLQNQQQGGFQNRRSDMSDMELAKLSVENERLKKTIKELQKNDNIRTPEKKMLGNVDESYLHKENEMLKKKLQDLEKEKQKITDELLNIKLTKVNSETNKDVNEKLLVKYNEKIKELENDLHIMTTELVQSRQKLGDAMNAAIEIGGMEFLDKLTIAMESNR